METDPKHFDPRYITEQRGELVEFVPDYPISPLDIDLTKPLMDAYGNSETEASAYWVIKLCQQKGSWEPFTDEEIEALYNKSNYSGYLFNQLVQPGVGFGIIEGNYPVGGGWITREEDMRYHITTAFVEAAYRSAPKS